MSGRDLLNMLRLLAYIVVLGVFVWLMGSIL